MLGWEYIFARVGIPSRIVGEVSALAGKHLVLWLVCPRAHVQRGRGGGSEEKWPAPEASTNGPYLGILPACSVTPSHTPLTLGRWSPPADGMLALLQLGILCQETWKGSDLFDAIKMPDHVKGPGSEPGPGNPIVLGRTSATETSET